MRFGRLPWLADHRKKIPVFGEFIHELTGPIIPTVLPGVHGVHAVDAAGVHPLLLAIGSERYVPYNDRRQPQELLTIANAILGQGQLSLAKYLCIVAREIIPIWIFTISKPFCVICSSVSIGKMMCIFKRGRQLIRLIIPAADLMKESKVVWAAVGEKRRDLATTIPERLALPDDFTNPRICLPGILCVQAPKYDDLKTAHAQIEKFCTAFTPESEINVFPLIVLVDDTEFTAQSLTNFLWVTFTRSNPAADIHGIGAFTQAKHWGCTGSARHRRTHETHHAPPLIEDADVTKRVDALAAPGGPLHRII